MNTRDWPIRSKLTALVIAPVSALLALWIFATTLTFGPALDLLSARTLLYDLGRPGETVVAELQRERRLSVVQLAGDGALPALAEQRRRTDVAVAELRTRVSGERLRDAADDLLDARVDRLLGALDALPAGRGFIDRREVDRTGAIGLYSGMVGAAFQAFSAMATLPADDLNRQVLALTALGRSRELLGQADALLAGVLVTGRFAEGEHAQLVQTIGNQRFLVESAVADLPADDRAAYQRLAESDDFARLRALQDTLVRADPVRAPAVDVRAWQASQDAVQRRLRDFELTQADGLAERTVPVAVGILVRLGAAGVLGLAAVVVSVVVSLRVGRSLAQRLSGVRTAALEMAEHRLPDVVTRLRRGEDVDVAREAPSLEYGRDEIGQVGHAFNEVGRTAVRAAVDEVSLRRGLNEVFLNIARRSQGLVHRQLALLDRMERRVEDPDELAELFRVDHLATRLRRHAEDLVILAGAAPGRGWRNPVAMVDLVRGAISEVESYDRVDIADMQPAATVGRAVGDIIHLLAELMENATAFSPPGTRVAVRGQSLPNGYALEITDQGLGMSAPAMEEANERLSTPPEFDPADSARLGLFVVARLAARHGVRVQLRRAAQGGVTAVVLIPPDLVTTEPPPGPSATMRDGSADDQRMAKVTRLSTLPRTRSPRITRERVDAPTAVVPLVPSRAVPADPSGEGDGLPRRVRRRGPAARPRPTAQDAPAPRAPEEARRLMSALQSGTARGRRDAAAGGAPVPPPTTTAAGRPPDPDAPAALPQPPTATERDV
ncbi:sensor protein QseC [Micromonospora sp. MW-13]|uniref:sensor histidine kinase n=1 Tax=Micromonospora sp. MW-13 TaxID=2094022 RepID=UPI000E4529AD|nr:nitrate- and nitrite sensing domain-containing protein [Micromonospora sp. MW-13]RGC66347.1 sensor protein QseC [Micromonospora sp. MW-13]